MPVIPVLEAEARGSWVWGEPGLHSKTLSQNKKKKTRKNYVIFKCVFFGSLIKNPNFKKIPSDL
jgi:hypothetical protein